MSSASLDKRAMALMAAALDQPSEDRIKWVQAASKGDSELAQRVITLLNVDKGASNQILRTGGAGQDVGEPPLPERIGPFRIIDCIGQGGMGAVYKAMRDIENFDHIVAIKVIRPGLMAESLIERLQRERQILANLNHPNIARLYDGGETDDGSPYIVMEYIDGKPLIDWADGRNLDLEDRIWIFRDLCQAVRYAHQNLIIHKMQAIFTCLVGAAKRRPHWQGLVLHLVMLHPSVLLVLRQTHFRIFSRWGDCLRN